MNIKRELIVIECAIIDVYHKLDLDPISSDEIETVNEQLIQRLKRLNDYIVITWNYARLIMAIHQRFINPTFSLLRIARYNIFNLISKLCLDLAQLESDDYIFKQEHLLFKTTLTKLVNFSKEII